MIDIEKVKSVYVGKSGSCCCGCSGRHSTYKPQIRKVVNLLNNLPDDAENVMHDSIFSSADIGHKIYIAYFE